MCYLLETSGLRVLAEHAQYCYCGERHTSSDFRFWCVQGKSLQRAFSNGAKKLQEGPLKGPPAVLDEMSNTAYDLKQKVNSVSEHSSQSCSKELACAGPHVCTCAYRHAQTCCQQCIFHVAGISGNLMGLVSMYGWQVSVPLTLNGTKLYGALRCPCRGVKMPMRRRATNWSPSGRLRS